MSNICLTQKNVKDLNWSSESVTVEDNIKLCTIGYSVSNLGAKRKTGYTDESIYPDNRIVTGISTSSPIEIEQNAVPVPKVLTSLMLVNSLGSPITNLSFDGVNSTETVHYVMFFSDYSFRNATSTDFINSTPKVEGCHAGMSNNIFSVTPSGESDYDITFRNSFESDENDYYELTATVEYNGVTKSITAKIQCTNSVIETYSIRGLSMKSDANGIGNKKELSAYFTNIYKLGSQGFERIYGDNSDYIIASTQVTQEVSDPAYYYVHDYRLMINAAKFDTLADVQYSLEFIHPDDPTPVDEEQYNGNSSKPDWLPRGTYYHPSGSSDRYLVLHQCFPSSTANNDSVPDYERPVSGKPPANNSYTFNFCDIKFNVYRDRSNNSITKIDGWERDTSDSNGYGHHTSPEGQASGIYNI